MSVAHGILWTSRLTRKNHMSDNPDFPVEIELGREIKDYPVEATNAKPKKGKSRMSYPTLYLNGIEGLRDLPKDGVALIYFHRNRIGIVDRENGDGPASIGGGGNGDEAEIEVRRLCLPEGGGDDGDDIASALKKFAKDNGHEDTGEESDEDDDEE